MTHPVLGGVGAPQQCPRVNSTKKKWKRRGVTGLDLQNRSNVKSSSCASASRVWPGDQLLRVSGIANNAFNAARLSASSSVKLPKHCEHQHVVLPQGRMVS